jgi:FK506-binding nuclear protein
MKYVGRFKNNGKVFDASKGAPFTFRLGVGEVIKGWDIGVKGMRVGDKRKLVRRAARARRSARALRR